MLMSQHQTAEYTGETIAEYAWDQREGRIQAYILFYSVRIQIIEVIKWHPLQLFRDGTSQAVPTEKKDT